MTEYKSTKGGAVQNFEENPDNPYVGQVWYNETTGNLRVRQTTLTSAWAAGGNLNTAGNSGGGFGIPTAAILTGGNRPNKTGITEAYNGSSWTEVNDLNEGRSNIAASGTQTSGLAYGGFPAPPATTAKTELWNGTTGLKLMI